jgi:quercetin dioxygenase-like cupin family protein
MKITSAGTRSLLEGSPETFTGTVSRDPLFDEGVPSRMAGSSVTFEPGARTVWHKHPIGQALVVTAGVGYVKSWGKPRQEIRQGDVVWIGPDEKHWHGATASTGMTHIAITESLNTKYVDWLEPVSEDDYSA